MDTTSRNNQMVSIRRVCCTTVQLILRTLSEVLLQKEGIQVAQEKDEPVKTTMTTKRKGTTGLSGTDRNLT